VAACEAAADDALAAGDDLDAAIAIAGECAANRTIAAGGSVEDAEVAREATETAVRDSQAAEEKQEGQAAEVKKEGGINALAGAGAAGAFVILLLLILAAKFVQMRRKREERKEEPRRSAKMSNAWSTFPTRRTTRNFANAFSRFNTGEEGINPLAEQQQAAQEFRETAAARREEEVKVAAVAAAEAAAEEEAKVAAEIAASVMVEEVNPMIHHVEEVAEEEEEVVEVEEVEEEVGEELHQELKMPHVMNPMHTERASPPTIARVSDERGLMNTIYAAATPSSLKEMHAKQQPAEKKKTQRQKKKEEIRHQKELMADEAGWTTYDKQRRFRGKNPLRPTLQPEEELDPEAVLVPEMMDMITKAEWMGLSKEQRAQRMVDLDEINDGHVDESQKALQEALKWTQRAAGADIDNDGHVDDMRSGAYGGGGAITLVGSAHRASQQFKTDKFEGDIDAGYHHRPRGKSGLQGFSIKELIEKRKQDELKNKEAKLTIGDRTFGTDQKSKPRSSWMSKMQNKRKGNSVNKWLSRSSQMERMKGVGKKGAGKKATAVEKEQPRNSRKPGSAPQLVLPSLEEEGNEEAEGDETAASFDGAVALSPLSGRLSPLSGPIGDPAPREKRLTRVRSKDVTL
jgi:hypothetical protein